MSENIGFNPVSDTIAVLSELELIYFVPFILMFVILLLTGTLKRRNPIRYRWKSGKGFERLDVSEEMKRLSDDQRKERQRRLDGSSS